MQKTFNVFIKNKSDSFRICSKKVQDVANKYIFRIVQIDDEIINSGTPVHGCDVSEFLKTLGLKDEEVIEAKVTFKID